MEIEDLRGEIDAIDRELLSLMAKRLELAMEINRAKLRSRLPLRDPAREEQVLQAAAEARVPPLRDYEAVALLKSVLAFSRAAVKRRMAVEDVKPLDIAVVGLGLIGGSIARALKRALPAHRIHGIDLEQRLEGPRESGLFDSLSTPEDGVEAVRNTDVVFLCAPPARNLELLPRIRGDVATGAVVTDVSGVKRQICDRARELFGTPGPAFVGGHPMAGKAHSGFEHSSPDLFEGRAWILTPDHGTSVAPLQTLKLLIESTGAAIQLITPEEHDRIIPAISHLPQLASVALMLTVGGRDRGVAGPALHDMTRLADSSPALWHELLSASRNEVVGEIQRLRSYLTEIEISLGLGEAVTEFFERARELHQDMIEGSVIDPPTGE